MASRSQHHASEAQRLLDRAANSGLALHSPGRSGLLAEAQVHASLALYYQAEAQSGPVEVKLAELPAQSADEVAEAAVVDMAKTERAKARAPRARKPKAPPAPEATDGGN